MIDGFFIGIAFSIALIILFSIYGVSRVALVIKAVSEIIKDDNLKAKEQGILIGSVNYRFKHLDQLTKKQLNLAAKLDSPNKGSSHSKWKNDLVSELNAIENEKRVIFQSFLDDKVDPTISVVDENGKLRSIKISELLNEQDTANETLPTKNKLTDPNANRNNVLKLIKGTEDDEDSTNKSSNPIIH